MALPTLGADEIIAFLDDCLEVEFTFAKSEVPAAHILKLPRQQQDYILNLVRRVADTNIELAYQLACNSVLALEAMDERLVEEWAMTATDYYDRLGLYPAMSVIRELDGFIDTAHERAHGSVLAEEAGVLLPFLHGLSGRKLKLQAGDDTYTDTETIFVPAIIALFEDRKQNFLLYKATVAHHWAQIHFGTFRTDLGRLPVEQLGVFCSLETIRLDACIRRELPGLHRQMLSLRVLTGETGQALANELGERLTSPGADVSTTLELLDRVAGHDLPAACYQGLIKPETVADVMSRRIEREKAYFRVALSDLAKELQRRVEEADEDGEQQTRFDLRQRPETDSGGGERNVQLEFDGSPVAPPQNVRELMSSIIVDFGGVPPEYLVAAGPGEYDLRKYEDSSLNPDDVWKGSYHEEGAMLYNEWNFKRQSYHKNWCVLREIEVTPVYDDFVADTLDRHRGVLKSLRHTFEILRGEDRLLRRQPYGDDIDIDAYVEAHADVTSGMEMTNRLFTKMHKEERNIAVIFMVDMSGSTRGWINRAERESLVLLAEALEILGDRYAIYGFSGMTRKRCELYRIKTFDDAWDDETRGRVSNIQPHDYTRMGVFIRHVIRHFGEVEASTKLLITLSDGKPDDYDTYRGEYGVEDTRQALFEARREGIHAYCITIDEQARDYLPHMYGAANYTVIDDIGKLPLKVSDIYRRITT